MACQKEIFDWHGKPLPVVQNVHLIKGLFNKTLPGCLKQHANEPVAYASIDCDLYTGAEQVLGTLRGRLRVGTLLHFHELFSERAAQNPQEDLRALHDLLKEEGRGVSFELLLTRSSFHEAAILRVAGLS